MLSLPDEAFTGPWPSSRHTFVRDRSRTGPLWSHPHRGVTQSVLVDADAGLARVLAAAVALPGVPLGTWAAALLHGVPDLDGTNWAGELLDVVFCPGRSGARAPRPGLRPLRSTLTDADVVPAPDHPDIPITSPLRTAFDVGRMAPSLPAAVADLDAVLRVTQVPVPALAQYAADRRGWKGVQRVRAALPLLDPRAASRPESLMRVVWRLDADLPPPQVNVPVYANDGTLLGKPDLLDVESGLVAEFDGAHHRQADQHADDNVREELFEAHGLTVVRAMFRDVRSPFNSGLVARLRTGYRRAVRATERQDGRSWFVPPSHLRG